MPSALAAAPPITPPVPRIRVEGAFELALAFRSLDKNLGNGIKEALEDAAEPIRSGASTLAREEISGMTRGRIAWWQMRIGSNLGKGLVYIAPLQRGVTRFNAQKARPKFAPILLRPMLESLNANAGRVENEFEATLDDALRAWERI